MAAQREPDNPLALKPDNLANLRKLRRPLARFGRLQFEFNLGKHWARLGGSFREWNLSEGHKLSQSYLIIIIGQSRNRSAAR